MKNTLKLCLELAILYLQKKNWRKASTFEDVWNN